MGLLGATGATLLLTLFAATAHLDVQCLFMPLPCAGVLLVHGRLIALAHRSLRFTAR